MKKILCLLGILILAFCACSQNTDDSANTSSKSVVPSVSTESVQSTTLPEDVTTPPPPMYNSEDYNSVEELIKDLLSNESFVGEALNEFEEYEPAKGKTFRKFVEKLRNSYLYVPYLNGKEIAFQNEEGFSNITLFPSELYSQPWIWYFPNREQTGINWIGIMYLDDDIKDEASKKSGSWLRTQLNPNYPNTHNYKDSPYYENIYDSTMEFNGHDVNILVIKETDDPRLRTFFVYKDVLVCVTSIESPEKWSKGLTFEKVPVK